MRAQGDNRFEVFSWSYAPICLERASSFAFSHELKDGAKWMTWPSRPSSAAMFTQRPGVTVSMSSSVDFILDACAIKGDAVVSPALRRDGRFFVSKVAIRVSADAGWCSYVLRRLSPSDFREVFGDADDERAAHAHELEGRARAFAGECNADLGFAVWGDSEAEMSCGIKDIIVVIRPE